MFHFFSPISNICLTAINLRNKKRITQHSVFASFINVTRCTSCAFMYRPGFLFPGISLRERTKIAFRQTITSATNATTATQWQHVGTTKGHTEVSKGTCYSCRCLCTTIFLYLNFFVLISMNKTSTNKGKHLNLWFSS